MMSIEDAFPGDSEAAKTIRETYREVRPGVYESNAPPLSKFHQQLLNFFARPVYKLSEFCHRHGLARGEQAALNLAYRLRAWVWRRHDRRIGGLL